MKIYLGHFLREKISWIETKNFIHVYKNCYYQRDITFDNEFTFTNLIALVTTLKKISSATEAKILSITPNRRDLFFIQNTFCDKKFIRATIWLYETRTIGSLQWLSRLKTIFLLKIVVTRKNEMYKFNFFTQIWFFTVSMNLFIISVKEGSKLSAK